MNSKASVVFILLFLTRMFHRSHSYYSQGIKLDRRMRCSHQRNNDMSTDISSELPSLFSHHLSACKFLLSSLLEYVYTLADSCFFSRLCCSPFLPYEYFIIPRTLTVVFFFLISGQFFSFHADESNRMIVWIVGDCFVAISLMRRSHSSTKFYFF